MGDSRNESKQRIEVLDSSNTSLRSNTIDSQKIHRNTEGYPNTTKQTERKQEINKIFACTIENLKKVRIEVISRSTELINIIETITKLKLSIIKTHQDECNNALKKFIENDTEKLKDFQNIQFTDSRLESLEQIAKKKFSFFMNHNEMIFPELETLIKETKVNTQKFLKNLEEIKQKSFFLLEGHHSNVTSVVLTADNKFAISGSDDSTIRI